MPDSPTLSRAVQLALQYIGFGQAKRKQVTQESVDAVLGNGDLQVGDATLRTSGDVRGVQAGTTVPVLWSRANLAPGQHGVKPAVVLAHQKREGPPPVLRGPPSVLVVAGAVEELFIALDETGQLDVWFRNDVLCAPLNVRGALAARGPITHPVFAGVNLAEQLMRVRWGTKADRFHVELGGPPGAYFAVFQLVRTATAAGVFKRLRILPAVLLKRLEPVGVAEFDLGVATFEHRLSGNRRNYTVRFVPAAPGVPSHAVVDDVQPMDGSYARRSQMHVVLGPAAFYRAGNGVTQPPQHFGDGARFRTGHLTGYVASAVVDDAWQLAVTLWFAFNGAETHRGGQFSLRAWLLGEGTGGVWTSAVARYYRVEALDADGDSLAVSCEFDVYRTCPDGGTNTATFGVPPYAITRTVQLRWDRVPHAARYRIYRSETPNVYTDALVADITALEGPDPTFGVMMQGYVDVGAPTGAGSLLTGLDPGGPMPHPIGTHYWLGLEQNFRTAPGSANQLGIDNNTAVVGTVGFAAAQVTQCRWKPGLRNVGSPPQRTIGADDPDAYFLGYHATGSNGFSRFALSESHTAMLLLDASTPAPGWRLLWGSYDFSRGVLLDYASDLWFTRAQISESFGDPLSATTTGVWTFAAPLPAVNDLVGTNRLQLKFEGLPGAVTWLYEPGGATPPTLIDLIPDLRYESDVPAPGQAADLGNVGEGSCFSFQLGYHNGVRATMRGDLFPETLPPYLPARALQYFHRETPRQVDAHAYFFLGPAFMYLKYGATLLHTFKVHNSYVSALPLRWTGTTPTLLLVNVELQPEEASFGPVQPTTRLRQAGLFLYNPQTQETHAIRPLANYTRFFFGLDLEWPLHEPIFYPLQWTQDFVVWTDFAAGGVWVTHLPAAGAPLATATTVQVSAGVDYEPWNLGDAVLHAETDALTLAYRTSDSAASFLRLGNQGDVQSLYDRREVGGHHFLDWLDANEPRVGFQDEAAFPKRASLTDPELPAVLKPLPAIVLDADGTPVIRWASYRMGDLAPP